VKDFDKFCLEKNAYQFLIISVLFQYDMLYKDEDGNNLKADGKGTITVTELDYSSEKVGRPYSYDVEFEKDGFVTWTDNLGDKHTAYAFYINQEFAGKGLSWDVSMEITLESGLHWPDVDTKFTSFD